MLEEHLICLRAVCEKLREAGLKLKPSKCEFYKESLTYLGHKTSENGIETDNRKIKVPVPKTVTEVRSFLGFTNYVCRSIYKMHRSLNLCIN